ncbi:MAG TPA: hypothetical protein VFW80_12680 [Gaiellaceae bacterium]|nr:hypothetical protein [Gaiellaceae bacterium]
MGRATPHKALGKRRMTLIVLAVGFIVAASFSLSDGVSAAYACGENGTIFWSGGGGLTNARGNRQDLVVRAHGNGGCGHTFDIRAGGTVHMTGPPGNNLVELGWRDYIACCNPDTDHEYVLFGETVVSGSGHVQEYSDPACTYAGNTVTMRIIRGTTTNVWVFHRKCNGGSYAQIGSGWGTNFWSASPRVETFRFGPSGGGGFILDYHNDLDFKKKDNTWRGSFGTMNCEWDSMNDTKGLENGNPATSWKTSDTSGTECPP